jgi:hypothetical protein
MGDCECHCCKSATLPASRGKSEHHVRRPVVRPSTGGSTDGASSPHHAAPSPPDVVPALGRGGSGTRRAPPRRSGKARTHRWWLSRPCDRVRPHVLTPSCRSLRRREALPPLLFLAARHAARFTSPACSVVGTQSCMARPTATTEGVPGLGRTPAPCARLLAVRPAMSLGRHVLDRQRPRADQRPPLGCPGGQPTRPIQPSSPMHRTNHAGEMERAQGFTSNPTDLCLRL